MRHGYTGHLFEAEVFGTCRPIRWSGYVHFKEALRLVRRHQPDQPTPTVSKLRTLIARELDTVRGEVGFFTAVKSPLDFLHGADAVAVFNGHVVTIDVTLDPNKDSYKADVIVCADDLEDLKEVAGRIARRIQERQKREARR